jgi:sirohydrochlorin ferrochelatase
VSTGIIVFAHGSRIEPANQAVRAVAAELARAGSYQHVIAAFLELGQPDLETAAIELSKRGVRRIAIIPYFLTLGMHLERDLPRIVERISNNHNQLEISVSPPLDGHPGLLQVLLDRAREALS